MRLNNQNKFFTLLLAFLTIALILYVRNRSHRSPESHKPKVGILQTASHPALDRAIEGFIASLQKECAEIGYEIINAQGSTSQAHMGATQFVQDQNVKAIFAVGTLSAQAAKQSTSEKPIFIAAVTDPVATGIYTSGSNVCGAQDKINVAAHIETIKKYFPSAKKIGIIFNNGELNSQLLVEEMLSELKKNGVSAIKLAISQESEIIPTLNTHLPHIDLLWAPTDNTVALAAPLIGRVTREAKKPFFASDPLLVKSGATAALGIDYAASGALVGTYACQVLNGSTTVQEIGIVQSPISALELDHASFKDL